MSATIRQEINIIDTTDSATISAGNVNGTVQLDTTQYVNPTYYFEVVHKGAASNTGTWKLRRGTTDDATTVAYTGTTYIRERVSFTPPAGQTEYFLRHAPDGSRNIRANAARIIVIDTGTITKTETQIDASAKGGSVVSATSAAAFTDPKYWLYTAANWNGTKTFYAEVTYSTQTTNTATITLQEDDGSFGGWADKVTIVNAVSNTSATRARSGSFTPTDGRNYRIAGKSGTNGQFVAIYNGKVIVDQSASPTLFEPQYLLLNTTDIGTGLQSYQTLWDSTEWSGVTNVYKSSHDATNAADAQKLYDVTGAADITSATETGANQQISSAFTMPTTGHEIDSNVTNSTGVVGASRIIVALTINAPTPHYGLTNYGKYVSVGNGMGRSEQAN